MPELAIAGRRIGHPPLVIAEIGINTERSGCFPA
jgi:hypothetical protein